MKAKVIKTGEIYNIPDYSRLEVDACDSYGTPLSFGFDEVEIINDTVDGEPKTKFGPFDKVLSRYNTDYKWDASFYYQLVDINGNLYQKDRLVIPYNEETKHLINTYTDYERK